eukprot:9126813-Pyramimonas_sp.AAC.1
MAIIFLLATGTLPMDRRAVRVAARCWIRGMHGRVRPYVAFVRLARVACALGCNFASDLSLSGAGSRSWEGR